MVNAIERIVAVSENLGIIGFFVDTKNDRAIAFYRQFGFIELPDKPMELFLPIATLRQAFLRSGFEMKASAFYPKNSWFRGQPTHLWQRQFGQSEMRPTTIVISS